MDEYNTTPITQVEQKTHIAADAGQAIAAYLEELTEKMVKAKIRNAYANTSQIEEKIIDLLLSQESTTKIGLDVVLSLIHTEIGTPDEVVTEYQSMEKELKSMHELMEISTTKLKKREKVPNNKYDEMGISRFTNIASLIILLLSAIFNTAITHFISMFEDYIYYNLLVQITIISIFIFKESNSGNTGKLPYNYWLSKNFRYLVRGSFLVILMNNYLIFRINDNDDSLLISLFIKIVLFYIYEYVIRNRDTKIGKYPLEPNGRSALRYISLPYLFLIFGMISFIAIPYGHNNEEALFGNASIILGAFAGISAYAMRKDVSIRFYLVSYYLQTFPNIYYWGLNDYISLLLLLPLSFLIIDIFSKIVLGKPMKMNELYRKLELSFSTT